MMPLYRCFECKPSFCLIKMEMMPVPAMTAKAINPAKNPKIILNTRKPINPKRKVPAA